MTSILDRSRPLSACRRRRRLRQYGEPRPFRDGFPEVAAAGRQGQEGLRAPRVGRQDPRGRQGPGAQAGPYARRQLGGGGARPGLGARERPAGVAGEAYLGMYMGLVVDCCGACVWVPLVLELIHKYLVVGFLLRVVSCRVYLGCEP